MIVEHISDCGVVPRLALEDWDLLIETKSENTVKEELTNVVHARPSCCVRRGAAGGGGIDRLRATDCSSVGISTNMYLMQLDKPPSLHSKSGITTPLCSSTIQLWRGYPPLPDSDESKG